MRYTCTLTHLPNGQWLAPHTGSKLGPVEVTAASRDEAQVKLQNELQYGLNYARAAACREKQLCFKCKRNDNSGEVE